MTTLPLGGSVEDLDTFQSSHLDVPLVALLKSMSASVAPDSFVEVRLWAQRRLQMKDIDHLNPELKTSLEEFGKLECELLEHGQKLETMKAQNCEFEQKLDVACRAMLSRQHKRALELFPDKDPKETDFYKAHAVTVSTWKDDKLAPHVLALKDFTKAGQDIESQQRTLMGFMADSVCGVFTPNVESTDLDDDLMSELASIVEGRHEPKVGF